MPTSRTKANRKWNEANLDRLYVTVPKGEKDEIKAAADAAGESVNGYIKLTIDKSFQKPVIHIEDAEYNRDACPTCSGTVSEFSCPGIGRTGEWDDFASFQPPFCPFCGQSLKW